MSIKRIGIDVSKHNGIINWDKVKDAGVEFAMIRGGYGLNTVDPQFIRNITECNRLNIPAGAYWFSYATSEADALKEAEFCLKTIEKYKIRYPVVYDFEYDSVKYAKAQGITVSGAIASRFADAFLTKIGAAGYTPVLYANPDYLKTMFASALVAKYDLWLAHYASAAGRDCSIWQYSDAGQINGIVGNVDLNICYKDYTVDQEDISPWAVSAWKKAIEKGINDGKGAKNPVTEEQMMVFFDRLGLLD